MLEQKAIMNLRSLRVSLAVVLLCAGGTAASQTYSAFSGQTIYGSLKHKEAVSFNQAAASVLRNPKDGEVTLWVSPVGTRAPVVAKLYADGSREEKGMPCRRLNTELERGPTQERWEFWFCQRADGEWKAVSQTQR